MPSKQRAGSLPHPALPPMAALGLHHATQVRVEPSRACACQASSQRRTLTSKGLHFGTAGTTSAPFSTTRGWHVQPQPRPAPTESAGNQGRRRPRVRRPRAAADTKRLKAALQGITAASTEAEAMVAFKAMAAVLAMARGGSNGAAAPTGGQPAPPPPPPTAGSHCHLPLAVAAAAQLATTTPAQLVTPATATAATRPTAAAAAASRRRPPSPPSSSSRNPLWAQATARHTHTPHTAHRTPHTAHRTCATHPDAANDTRHSPTTLVPLRLAHERAGPSGSRGACCTWGC